MPDARPTPGLRLTPEQEAYDKGRRDERERIVRLLQEMYARHYQMARQERDKWVRMAHHDQARAIEEAIRRIEEDRALEEVGGSWVSGLSMTRRFGTTP